MKWGQFKQIFESTPNRQLVQKLGVRDNFPILISCSNLNKLKADLRETGTYAQHKFENDWEYGRAQGEKEPAKTAAIALGRDVCRRFLAYIPGTVTVQFRRWGNADNEEDPVWKNSIWRKISEESIKKGKRTSNETIGERARDFHRKKFNREIMLHRYQIKRMPFPDERAIGLVSVDMAESVLIPKGIEFCLPDVAVYYGRNTRNYSAEVYWPDSLEEEFFREVLRG